MNPLREVEEIVRRATWLPSETIARLLKEEEKPSPTIILDEFMTGGDGRDYPGASAKLKGRGISIVHGPPRTGKTMTYDSIRRVLTPQERSRMPLGEVRLRTGEEIVKMDSSDPTKHVITTPESLSHFVDQFGTGYSVLYHMPRHGLAGSDDMSNLIDTVGPRRFSEILRHIRNLHDASLHDSQAARVRHGRILDEIEDVERTLADLTRRVEGHICAFELLQDQNRWQTFQRESAHLFGLLEKRQHTERKIIARRRKLGVILHQQRQYQSPDTVEVLHSLLQSRPCSLCGNPPRLTVEEVENVRSESQCPICRSPFDWSQLEEQTAVVLEGLTSAFEVRQSLETAITNLEEKLLALDREIQTLGYDSSIATVDRNLLLDPSPDAKVLEGETTRYSKMLDEKNRGLEELRVELEDVSGNMSELEIRVSETEDLARRIERLLEPEHRVRISRVLDRANECLHLVLGSDDWFLAMEKRRFVLRRPMESEGRIMVDERRFKSPRMHRLLFKLCDFSLSLAILETLIESRENPPSFILLDSPEFGLDTMEIDRLGDLLEATKVPQIVLFTSSSRLRERFGSVCDLSPYVAIRGRSEAIGIAGEASEQMALEIWGLSFD